jgi:hypothetical protein
VEVTKEFPVAHKEVLGTIVFKLYGDIDPGQHGYGYEGTLFNHIILGCLMQAGHVVTPSGQRGQVVYSRTLTGMSIF